MTPIDRRTLIARSCAVALTLAVARRTTASTGPTAEPAFAPVAPSTSTTPPPAPVAFRPGDVIVGCTELNNADDDHAGRGRLLHYDAELRLRNKIWIDDTTHIVQSPRFAPDGTLWACDPFAWKVLRFSPAGERLADFPAPRRAFGHATFTRDGSILLAEHLVGDTPRAPLGTTLPRLPGTGRFGDGHLWRLSPQGEIEHEYATATHGGLGGFLGLTSSALSEDERTLYYVSETGPKIFRYDLENDRQLDDFASHPDGAREFYFDVTFDPDGRLLAGRGATIEALDDQARVQQTYTPGGFGWASLSRPIARTHFYAANWFTGELAKIDLVSGEVLARANTGGVKSTAGIAEVPALSAAPASAGRRTGL